MDDYLLEGSEQNFTSITVLRLYLGEKISFFFAWKSYMTCALLFVAVPGLILQIYIIY
jgi:anoctamin-8